MKGPGGADGRGRLDCRIRDGESLLCSSAWILLRQARAGLDLLLYSRGWPLGCTFGAMEEELQ